MFCYMSSTGKNSGKFSTTSPNREIHCILFQTRQGTLWSLHSHLFLELKTGNMAEIVLTISYYYTTPRITGNKEILGKSQTWVETSAQSPFQKSNFGNNSQKTCKSRYQNFLVLSSCTWFLYFVPNILSRNVETETLLSDLAVIFWYLAVCFSIRK